MSNTPPAVGQEPWGEDLNAYLLWLEGIVNTLDMRVAVLEEKNEYIFNSAPWQFSSNLPPATGNQLRLNNAVPSAATVMDFRLIDTDGADRTAWFQVLNVGSLIRVQDWNNSLAFYRYDVTGPATISGGNAHVPVVWVKGAGTVPNAKCNVGFVAVFTL